MEVNQPPPFSPPSLIYLLYVRLHSSCWCAAAHTETSASTWIRICGKKGKDLGWIFPLHPIMVSLVDARSPSGLDFPLFAKYTKYHTTTTTTTTTSSSIPYRCHTRPPTYLTQGSTTKYTKQTSSFLDCLLYYSPVVQNKILAQNSSTNSKIYKIV